MFEFCCLLCALAVLLQTFLRGQDCGAVGSATAYSTGIQYQSGSSSHGSFVSDQLPAMHLGRQWKLAQVLTLVSI